MVNLIVEDVRLNQFEQRIFEYGYDLFKQETRINSYFLHQLQGFCDSANDKYAYKVSYSDSRIVFIIRNTKLENTLGIIDDYKIIMFWDFKKGV